MQSQIYSIFKLDQDIMCHQFGPKIWWTAVNFQGPCASSRTSHKHAKSLTCQLGWASQYEKSTGQVADNNGQLALWTRQTSTIKNSTISLCSQRVDHCCRQLDQRASWLSVGDLTCYHCAHHPFPLPICQILSGMVYSYAKILQFWPILKMPAMLIRAKFHVPVKSSSMPNFTMISIYCTVTHNHA